MSGYGMITKCMLEHDLQNDALHEDTRLSLKTLIVLLATGQSGESIFVEQVDKALKDAAMNHSVLNSVVNPGSSQYASDIHKLYEFVSTLENEIKIRQQKSQKDLRMIINFVRTLLMKPLFKDKHFLRTKIIQELIASTNTSTGIDSEIMEKLNHFMSEDDDVHNNNTLHTSTHPKSDIAKTKTYGDMLMTDGKATIEVGVKAKADAEAKAVDAEAKAKATAEAEAKAKAEAEAKAEEETETQAEAEAKAEAKSEEEGPNEVDGDLDTELNLDLETRTEENEEKDALDLENLLQMLANDSPDDTGTHTKMSGKIYVITKSASSVTIQALLSEHNIHSTTTSNELMTFFQSKYDFVVTFAMNRRLIEVPMSPYKGLDTFEIKYQNCSPNHAIKMVPDIYQGILDIKETQMFNLTPNDEESLILMTTALSDPHNNITLLGLIRKGSIVFEYRTPHGRPTYDPVIIIKGLGNDQVRFKTANKPTPQYR